LLQRKTNSIKEVIKEEEEEDSSRAAEELKIEEICVSEQIEAVDEVYLDGIPS